MNKIETDSENRLAFVKGEEGLGGKGWEFGISRRKLLLIYMWTLKNKTNVYTKEKQTHGYRIQTCGYQREEGKGTGTH